MKGLFYHYLFAVNDVDAKRKGVCAGYRVQDFYSVDVIDVLTGIISR